MQITGDEFMRKVLAAFPEAIVTEDEHGELVINTNFVKQGDIVICFAYHDSGDNPVDSDGCAECTVCGAMVNAIPD